MTQLLLFNITNGLIVGAFYVLMALGLSLILNLSNTINFAHGGFLVIGGYIAYAITPYVGFWGALLIAPPLTAVIGLVVERVLIRPLYGRDPLYSLLLTFGLAFIIIFRAKWVMIQNRKRIDMPLVRALMKFTPRAAVCGLSPKRMIKKRPMSAKRGAPGGWGTSSLKQLEMNSPQSQKLPVASMVMV